MQRILAEGRREDAKAKYQLGVLVNDVRRDPKSYGKRGVQQLAAALGYKANTLYTYATVAACWVGASFDELLAKRGVTGLPLSFSHLLVIATIDSAKCREDFVGEVLDQGLRVRELKRRIDARPAKAKTGIDALPPAENAVRLNTLGSRAATWLETVRQWEKDLLPVLEQDPPQHRRGLEEALARQQELLDRLGRVVVRLRAVLDAPCASGTAHAGEGDWAPGFVPLTDQMVGLGRSGDAGRGCPVG